VIWSINALRSRALGITVVHSENGKLAVTMTAIAIGATSATRFSQTYRNFTLRSIQIFEKP
jgi:hypothetical protein